MNTRPPRGVWVFALVALGVTLARWLPGVEWAWLIGVGAAVSVVSIAAPKKIAWSLAAVGAVALAWGWSAARWEGAPNRLDRVIQLGEHERALVELEGALLDDPQRVPANTGALGGFAGYDNTPLRARLRVTGLASGVVRLRIQRGETDLRAGDRVRVSGWLTGVRPAQNPGARDFSRWSAERGLVGTLSVPDAALVERTGGPGSIGAHAARWRASLQRAAERALPEGSTERGVLLRALVLGERTGGYDGLAQPFARTGLAHVLAISGMHLGVLAGLGVLVVRATGERPRLEALVVALLVGLVLLLVPARAPIVRAAVIALALTLGALGGRRYSPVALLAWAGVLVIAWRPTELFSPGFQLSFGVVWALIVLAPRVDARWFGATGDPNTRTLRDRCWLWLRRAIAASVVAWAVSLALVAHAFGIVTFVAPLTAILSVPLAGLVLMLGYGAVVLELLLPGSGGAASGALLASTEPLLALVRAFDALPLAGVRVPALSAGWATGGTLLAIAWCAFGSGRGVWRGVFAIGALVMGSWTLVALRAPGVGADVALRLDALALGDGSCWFVRSGDEAMVFDCGSRWTGAGVRAIPDAARALGIPPARVAIVSHPDLDHYACLPDASERLGVRTLLVGERFTEQARERANGAAAALLSAMCGRGVEVRTIGVGDTWALGEATVEVLGPPDDAPFRSDNDHAIALRITAPTDAGVRTVLLLGDLEEEGLDALTDAHPALHADVIEAPHHGSARDFAVEFVLRMDPDVVLQSTGPTRVDHPIWAPVRERARWLTTATGGAIGVEILRDGTIETFSSR